MLSRGGLKPMVVWVELCPGPTMLEMPGPENNHMIDFTVFFLKKAGWVGTVAQKQKGCCTNLNFSEWCGAEIIYLLVSAPA